MNGFFPFLGVLALWVTVIVIVNFIDRPDR
jgi:hypothetical protein